MNWIKTYESFIYEAATSSDNLQIKKFEDLIGLPENTGIITSVMYNNAIHELQIGFAPKLNSFDTGYVLKAIESNKKKIAAEYSGIKHINAGSTSIKI
jgi:hypothetical protein